MTAMKEMLRDEVQTVMEVELDEELGRERCQRAEASNTAPNYRNGCSRKTVKTQLGEAVFPKSRLQRCIVHQIRSSTRFVSWKDIKQAAAGLKKIHTAVPLEEAGENPFQFWEKWRRQCPSCVKSREENRVVLSTFYEYPPEVRKIIYTTNIIEGLNRQSRQITKNKPSFANDDSLRRMPKLGPGALPTTALVRGSGRRLSPHFALFPQCHP